MTPQADASAPTVRISGVAAQSIVDGPGLRLAVFTQGCPHGCPGCHNPETHPFDGGTDVTVAALLAMLDANPLLCGVTLTGGEPLCRAAELLPFARAVRERGKDIVCFTGYTFERLLVMRGGDTALAELLDMVFLLIDGPYDRTRRDLTLAFRGSGNQRLLDLPASLAKMEPVLWEADGRFDPR